MTVKAACILPHPPVLVPEVGRGREKEISSTADACHRAAQRIAPFRPDTIVLISPHSTCYADYFHLSPGDGARGDLAAFGAPQATVSVQYDTEFVQDLSDRAAAAGIPAGPLGEEDPDLDHGSVIPLLFLKLHLADYRLVRIGLSNLSTVDHYRLGQMIAETAAALNRRVVVIASGDLSHKVAADGPYGFIPEGPEFDRQITEIMKTGDFLRALRMDPVLVERAAECGYRPILVLAGSLDGLAVDADFFSYEDTFGVGYGVAAFVPVAPDPDRHLLDRFLQQEQRRLADIRAGEDLWVHLARRALETRIRTGRPVSLPENLPEDLTAEAAGVFVSLKKHGQLRGCIGTVTPVTASVAEEILRNAVSAGLEDPRFDPVRPEELADLVYSVDVLKPAEPVASADQLDTSRYGVIVSCGHRRGLLLPDLEGVDTPAQQLSIALQKAGIRPEEPYRIERFEVVRHR